MVLFWTPQRGDWWFWTNSGVWLIHSSKIVLCYIGVMICKKFPSKSFRLETRNITFVLVVDHQTASPLSFFSPTLKINWLRNKLLRCVWGLPGPQFRPTLSKMSTDSCLTVSKLLLTKLLPHSVCNPVNKQGIPPHRTVAPCSARFSSHSDSSVNMVCPEGLEQPPRRLCLILVPANSWVVPQGSCSQSVTLAETLRAKQTPSNKGGRCETTEKRAGRHKSKVEGTVEVSQQFCHMLWGNYLARAFLKVTQTDDQKIKVLPCIRGIIMCHGMQQFFPWYEGTPVRLEEKQFKL